MTIKIYKIKSTVSNQYSKGGTGIDDQSYGKPERPRYYHWSPKGKIWQGTGPIRNHLNQYVGWQYGKLPNGRVDYNNKTLVNRIPDTWIVEEHLPEEGVTYSYLAKDFYENKKPKRL